MLKEYWSRGYPADTLRLSLMPPPDKINTLSPSLLCVSPLRLCASARDFLFLFLFLLPSPSPRQTGPLHRQTGPPFDERGETLTRHRTADCNLQAPAAPRGEENIHNGPAQHARPPKQPPNTHHQHPASDSKTTQRFNYHTPGPAQRKTACSSHHRLRSDSRPLCRQLIQAHAVGFRETLGKPQATWQLRRLLPQVERLLRHARLLRRLLKSEARCQPPPPQFTTKTRHRNLQ